MVKVKEKSETMKSTDLRWFLTLGFQGLGFRV